MLACLPVCLSVSASAQECEMTQAALGRGLVGAGPYTRGTQPCDRAVAVQGAVSQSGHLPWPYC